MAFHGLSEELLLNIVSQIGQQRSVGPVRKLSYYNGRSRGSHTYDLSEGPFSSSIVLSNFRNNNYTLNSTLLSCILANKQLHRIAKSVLYHTICSRKLENFLETSSRDIRLTEHVRQLYVSEADGDFGLDVSGICDRLVDGPVLYKSMFPETSLSVAMLAIMLCTNVETIGISMSANLDHNLAKYYMAECARLSRYGQPRSASTLVPLTKLRTLAIDCSAVAPTSDFEYWDCEYWFQGLTYFPSITSIELTGPCSVYILKFAEEGVLSTLKSLVINEWIECQPTTDIKHLLQCCPLLEHLDLTAYPSDEFNPRDTWTELGLILSTWGSSLRSFRYDDTLGSMTPSVINLKSLPHLQYLALPLDALINFGRNKQDDLLQHQNHFSGNRHGYGSRYDLEDMWVDSTTGQYKKNSRQVRDGIDEPHEYCGLHTYEVPLEPLSNLLPGSLQHLRILDDWNFAEEACVLDDCVRDLILDPQFSELCDVQVRRRRVFTRHVKGVGWQVERRPFWNVMKRI